MNMIHELKKELKASKIELESMKKLVHMLNSSKDDLNKNLSSGKQVSDRRGIGFNSHEKHSDKGVKLLYSCTRCSSVSLHVSDKRENSATF